MRLPIDYIYDEWPEIQVISFTETIGQASVTICDLSQRGNAAMLHTAVASTMKEAVYIALRMLLGFREKAPGDRL